MRYGWFNFSKKPDPAIDNGCEKRDAAAKARKRLRLDTLCRKYENVPIRDAVRELFWGEGRLTIPEIAKILRIDEDAVSFEIDRAKENAR